jgi:E3 ubiquitin-protein ligase RNF115/126
MGYCNPSCGFTNPQRITYNVRVSPFSALLNCCWFDTSASRFVQHRDEGEMREGPRISGPLFAHYLMSLLGQTDHPMLPMFMGGVPEGGRMGDYVFSQEGE